MWWTLVAAIVGSVTALLIAFVAYPWQKAKDRELKLFLERLDLAREFNKQIEIALFVDSDSEWALDPKIQRLIGLQSEMKFVMKNSDTEEAARETCSYIYQIVAGRRKRSDLSSDAENVLWDQLKEARERFAEAMKAELT